VRKIAPCLWFGGKAEEAARFYVSLLPDSRIDAVVPYSMDLPGGSPGDVMMVEFTLAGQAYLALNGNPSFQFTPAVSFAVGCADQAEVDRLWDALCEGGSPGRCGWLTDRFGVSWQIVPTALIAMMKDEDVARVRRVTQAMLPMSKLDLRALRAAFDNAVAA
jgi:predicted 3-demethylubiquinone-9 3-methyltransferase (glyoxalase superfamily)